MRKITNAAMRGMAALALAASAAAPATAMAEESATIEYLGGADAMVKPDVDVFEVGHMAAGESETGIVEVRNSSAAPVRLWFWAEKEGSEAGHADCMTIEIVDMDTEQPVYAGLLSTAGSSDPIDLGVYGPGEGASLAYEIGLPPDAAGASDDPANAVKWTFAAEQGDIRSAAYAPTGVDASGVIGLGVLLVAIGGGGIVLSQKTAAASR